MIKRIEKILKTDLAYLAKGGAWITINNIVSSIASFLLLIAFANLLPKNTYGTYQYVLSIAGILSIPTLSGINTSMVHAVARGYDGSIKKGLLVKIRWGLLGGLAGLILAGYYYFNDNITLSTLFLITAAFVPLMDSFKIYGSYLSGKKLFRESSIYGSLINIFRVISIFLALILSKNIIFIVLIYFASNTFLNSLFFWITLRRHPGKGELEDKSAISYGKHLSLMSILGNIATEVDRMFLFQYIGSVELAIYTFATSPITRISTLLSPITTLAFPKFSENKPEVLKETLPKKIFYLFLLMVPLTITYIIAAPWIYKIIFPKYIDSVIYSQVFALSLLFYPQKLLPVALTAHQQKRALYIINTASPLIKIIVLIILLPLFGIWGVIASVLISRLVNGLFSFYYFKKM